MAEDSVGYALCRINREQLEKLRDDGRHGGREAVAGYPYYYCAESGEIEVYPDMIAGRLEIRGDQVLYVPEPKADPYKSLTEATRQASRDFRQAMATKPDPWRPLRPLFAEYQKAAAAVDAAQRKEHPAQMPDAVVDELLHDQNVPCNICGQRGLHACAPPPAPTLIGSSPDPIVDMIEFKGRLWVATTKGVFVKRENEDAFDHVELIPAITGAGGLARAADEAAGLVPLHPRQTPERADPFVPNKFGEH